MALIVLYGRDYLICIPFFPAVGAAVELVDHVLSGPESDFDCLTCAGIDSLNLALLVLSGLDCLIWP